MSNIKVIINELKQQASWFENEAGEQKDKFNKGYFEGKAEQSHKLIGALEATNDADAIIALRDGV